MRFQQKSPRLTFHGGAHPQIGYASVFFAGHPGAHGVNAMGRL